MIRSTAIFTAPVDAGTGTVKVVLTCRSWGGRDVRPRTFDVPFETSLSRQAEQTFVMFHAEGIGLALARGKEIQERAAAIDAATSHARSSSGSDACFEISFADLKRVLGEKQTLAKVEAALQKLTRGAVYRTWDKSLSVAK